MSIKNIETTIKKFVSLIMIFIFNCLPIKNNKIFIFSYYGNQYGCNPKYISEYLFKKGQYDIVWAFDDLLVRNNLTGVKKVKVMSIRYFFELCTSKVIITNYRTTELFRKRNNQFYIQTWHSSLRLKQIEKDAEEQLPHNYIKMAKEDSKKIDLLVSGCKYSTNIFRRAFWYDGEILESGTPRNDLLFKESSDLRKEIFKRLDIPLNYKIVLYAPTFRKDNNLEVYNLDYTSVLNKLEETFGGKWIFLIKLHPHLTSMSEKIKDINSKLVVDVTKYDDIQELLSISDVLISDYSSLIFDYSITQRPCFLYVPDLDEYMNQDRLLYFDLKELPFTTASSNQKLLESITHFNEDKYWRDLGDFLDKIGSFERGVACESLTNKVEQICFNKVKRRVTYETL